MDSKDLIRLINENKSRRFMRLRGKDLSELPKEIGQLKSLRRLDVSNNNLVRLPKEIGRLKNLQRLDLSNNNLTEITSKIGELDKLEWLDLSSSKGLEELPQEIGSLVNLRWLDVSNTSIQTLPKSIAILQNLEGIDLSNSKIRFLPAEIGQLINLRDFDLPGNQLLNLPPEIGSLGKLRRLDLRSNKISELPKEMGYLTGLEELEIANNNLSIPPEIAERSQEPESILNYYFQRKEEGNIPFNEAKILIVGEAKVGKTSLLNRLIGNPFNPDEDKTQGINIQELTIGIANQDVKLNFWDFGGQEIMHATHQFFLTKRSLYLLVLDARRDEDGNRIEYWLKTIQIFGKDSPIIIVCNQVDQQPIDIDRRGLKKKYSSIQSFVETSCSTDEGIDRLSKQIQKNISKMEHVFDEFPSSWFFIKSKLEQEKKHTDYINYSSYELLCRENGLGNHQSQKTLINFLHDLGVILNFQDDPRLRQDSILNPEWVTNGVYGILNHNALITQFGGILEVSKLKEILNGERYPEDKHLFILDLMRKFELCFPLESFDNQKYLIPDLLTKEEPDTGNWVNGCLLFQYHYNVLHSSVISRFIVRSHDLVSRQTYWRNGAILEYESSRAIVKADKEDRKIFISIRTDSHSVLEDNQEDPGPNDRRVMLSMIRQYFDSIHKTLPGIKVEEKIPYPQQPDILIDYQHLLTLEKMGEKRFVPPGLDKQVSVKDLLKGLVRSEDFQRVTLNTSTSDTAIASKNNLNRNHDKRRSHSSPWFSGSFYLFFLFAITILFVISSQYLSWYALPIVLIASLFAMGMLSALQLRRDGQFSEDNLLQLMIESYKQLPLLRRVVSSEEIDKDADKPKK